MSSNFARAVVADVDGRVFSPIPAHLFVAENPRNALEYPLAWRKNLLSEKEFTPEPPLYAFSFVYIDELPMVNPPIVPFTAFILEMSQVSFMMQLSNVPLVAVILPLISAFLARKKPLLPSMRILQFEPFGSGLFPSVVLRYRQGFPALQETPHTHCSLLLQGFLRS